MRLATFQASTLIRIPHSAVPGTTTHSHSFPFSSYTPLNHPTLNLSSQFPLATHSTLSLSKQPLLIHYSPCFCATLAVQSAKAFPALTSYLQRSAGFHSQSTAFQAAQSASAQVEETEEELPTRFDEITSLHPNTAKAIKSIFKYETMSKVQAEVLSMLPTDTDMFVKAKTGTGKTLAFLIPALETVNAKCDKKTLARGDLATVLIVSPTRELAQQIADEARKVATPHRFNVHCLVGGESKGQQIRQLNNKRVDIVVGTPGRLNDMIESVREFRDQLEGVKTVSYFLSLGLYVKAVQFGCLSMTLTLSTSCFCT